MKDIAIYGAGGYGREMACYIERINSIQREWNLIGYFDDGLAKGSKKQYGEVLGGMEELNKWEAELAVVIAIGNPKVIQTIVNSITNNKVCFPNIIDPDALFLDAATVIMGRGNVFSPKTVVSCNVKIGDFNLFNINTGIGHDVTIGNNNVMMPNVNVSGGVVIGDRNLFGVKSSILQYLSMGSDNQVCAHSLIARNAKDHITYVGVPAVPVSKNE